MALTNHQSKHFVLVHGSCHGAWCWFKLKPLLEACGHRVSTVDLTASGINLTKIQHVATLFDYTLPLLDFMATLPPKEKVVLVGHSYGGLNIAVAMEKFPERVSIAIFLTAFMPDPTHNPSYVLDMYNEITPAEAWLDTQFVPFNDDPESEMSILFGPKFLSCKLYELCSDEDRELGKTLIRPSSQFNKDLKNAKRFTKEGFGSIRRAYIICDKDATIKKGFQEWMIDNNPAEVVKELKHVDHMPMLCDPKQLSLCLLDIANHCA